MAERNLELDRIKIAQIGVCHEHAQGKMQTLLRLPDIYDIVGVVDDRETSKTPMMMPIGSLKTYDGIPRLTLEEVLNNPEIQAVTVEVPNNDLVLVAMRCMERGLAMHMDKPAGEELAPYKKLLDGCKAKNLPFQMGFMFRGNPAFQFCIDAVRRKLIGDVFEMELDMNHCYGGELYQEYLGKFPGGIMYNLGCHLIDFVALAMGRPVAVTPFLKSAPGYPDTLKNNCLAVLEYPHAIVVVRACSKEINNTHGRRIKIAGTKGSIAFSPVERFDGKAIELSLDLATPVGDFPAGKHQLCFPPQVDRYEVQLRELAKIIRGEVKDPYTRDHDYLVHEITMAAAGYTQWRENPCMQ